MNLNDYIGKSLRELIKGTPDYAINFYSLTYKRNVYPHVKDILNNEELMNAEIKKIDDLTRDYTYWISLE